MNKIKWKRIMLVLLTGIGVTIIAAGSYWWNLAATTFTNIQEDIERKESEKRLEEISFEEHDPFSVLLMGIDEPEGEHDPYQRSDAIILVTVNPSQKSTQMVSIPRDTYTEIVGHGKKDKINHAYAFGGTKMTIRTVEHFLNVPIDYFIRVDMEGLADMVNAIGDIKVTNELDFKYKGVHFEKGSLQLNGEEAVAYSQMRKDDPRGDFGRQERQRKVISGLINKGASFSSITRVEEILNAIEDNVRTNLSLKEIWNIQSNYKDALHSVKQHEIKGEDGEMDETYYYMPDMEYVEVLSAKLNSHLESDDD
ncbi:LCP family protein [Thalassobacillus devorans]|uniref:LCP family glycopolymer transferase n=1 Tax=Thalassobacillus devorans TaxID=279813 RepID=UPI00048F0A6E|nr:LCP family protein [Thalassobacillus devorans]